MKKALSLILAFVLCISLCACGNDAHTEPPLETISMEELWKDTENSARATLNIGKATNICGQITAINSSNCKVALIYPKCDVQLTMATEQLAKLNKDDFIAAFGLVSAYEHSTYTIDYIKTLTKEEEDAYIQDVIDEVISFYEKHTPINSISDAKYFSELFEEKFSQNLLYEYVDSHYATFTLGDDGKVKNYLIGEWAYRYLTKYGNTYTYTADSYLLREDGTYLWKYGSSEHECEAWEVEYGRLKLSNSWGSGLVYVLSDHLFLHQGHLYIKIG